MKTISTFILAMVLISGVSAKAVYLSADGSGGTIYDNDASGLSSTVTFDNTVASISDVRVTLNISGGYNGDLYAYLVHDNTIAVLLNRIGTTGSGTFGSAQSGMNITLAQSGYFDVHTAGALPPGGFYNADGRFADPNNLNAVNSTADIRGLSGFNGGPSSGQWTLYISDVDGGGGDATLNSWNMEITGVPEPVNVALGVFGGGFVLLQGARFYKRKKCRESADA